jgi:putative transposase
VVGQHRSTQRVASRPPDQDKRLRRRLRTIAREHPRWGWRMAHRLPRRDGQLVNHKRIRRLWREEGLRRPVSCRKRRRTRLDTPVRLGAEYPNHVWALDFQFDETADGRRLKLLNVDVVERPAAGGRSEDAGAVAGGELAGAGQEVGV